MRHSSSFIKMNVSFYLCILMMFHIHHLFAQDTSKKQTVEIISSYKPVYREMVKQNLPASPLPPSTDKINYQYNLPVWPLGLSFQPSTLKPLSMKPDSIPVIATHYLKLGYGNYFSPNMGAGVSFGVGKPLSVQLRADHFSQRSNMRVQQFSHTAAEANITAKGNRHEWNGSLSYQRQAYWLYADDSTLNAAKDDSLRKPYQTAGFQLGWRNLKEGNIPIFYHPSVRASLFYDGRSSEKNMDLRLPLVLKTGATISVLFQGNVDLTYFRPKDSATYSNHIYSIHTAFAIDKHNWKLQAGVMPVWDRQSFFVLPKITTELRLDDDKLYAYLGWEGSVQKNNYQYLVSINPWINQPLMQFNTRKQDLYLGVKGTAADLIQFKLQLGLLQYRDQLLFDNSRKLSVFEILQENRLQAIQTKGEIVYRKDEQLEAKASVELNRFYGQRTETAPWHMIPVQVNASVSWKPIQKLQLRSQLFAWRGALYRDSLTGVKKRLEPVFDLNAGADYQFLPGWTAWLQLSNLFNVDYQRWHRYPVFGFQIHGGIKLTFGPKFRL
jgi:hypothetical protein